MKQMKQRTMRVKKSLARMTMLLLVCTLFAGAVHGMYVIVTEKPWPAKDDATVDYYTAPTPQKLDNTDEAAPAQGDWNLLLVNPWNPLPEGFSVERTTLKNGHSIDKRAYEDLQAMMDDARAAGLSPLICSSFRTMEKQQSLFDNQVAKYQARGYSEAEAKAEAARWVAIPGTSEHQSALAVDIVATSYQQLNSKQGETAEQKWLMEHCYEYGFVLRYPADKEDITGIGYEPWHYRYVGKNAAAAMQEQGISLEEYLQALAQ